MPTLVRHQVDPGVHTALTGHFQQEKAWSGPIKIREKIRDLIFQHTKLVLQRRKVGELGCMNVNYTN